MRQLALLATAITILKAKERPAETGGKESGQE